MTEMKYHDMMGRQQNRNVSVIPANRAEVYALLASVMAFWLWSECPVVQAVEPPQAGDKVDFARDIRPILANHCWSCHGPDEPSRKAGLRLDLASGATGKLDSGNRAIDPDNLKDSELLARITANDEAEVMPPPAFKKPLTARQIELLKRWVNQGAKYAQHWSFTVPVRAPIPQVQDRRWPKVPFDHFVLQRLEQAGLPPNPAASRETLLRRLTLDLTGVPPTLQELENFQNDSSPDAYERVVDRLLTSPGHAERMAVQWLDAARYADTNGYNNDEERAMWPWRDWVIRAFATNMPYDQFLTEQLAGDLLPNPTQAQRLATGFNRNHVLTTEGGIIEEEYRVEYVADRVHTTATVFLGLSFQCARCHDHKFDPIAQRDYYRFFAFFNNVSDKVVGYNQGATAEPFLSVPTIEQQHEAERITANRQRIETELAMHIAGIQTVVEKWEASLSENQKRVTVPAGQRFAVPLDETSGDQAKFTVPTADSADKAVDTLFGRVTGKAQWRPGKLAGAFEFDGKTFLDCGQAGIFDMSDKVSFGAWIHPTSNSPSTVLSKMDEPQAHRGYDLIIEGGKTAVHIIHHWPDNGLKVIAKQAMSLNAWHHVFVTWDGSSKAAGVRIYVDGELQGLDVTADALKDSIKTEQPLRIGQRTTSASFQGLIDDVRFFDGVLHADDIKRLFQGQSLATLAEIFATPQLQRKPEQIEQLRKYYLESVDADHRRWKSELASLAEQQKKLEQATTRMMVMAELPQPRDTRILGRGQYDQPGEKVAAGVPPVLAEFPADAPLNRLGLAMWLTSPRNPLTARVAVNRLWAGLFGAGLVETAEDFGTQGAFPSHPELLDYLAVKLIERGWDQRAILKEIVMSATYQQSSSASPRQMEVDPHNRLLGRGARYRLSAETIRDSALSVSGLLRTRQGGPSVKPYQPPGLWEDVSVERRYKYVPDQDDGRYRRSMYTFWKRTCPPPAMTTFDAPDRETCLIRRARTNTPLQALVLLNDPTYIEAARSLGARVLQAGDSSTEKRIDLACRMTLGRSPTNAERGLLEELVNSSLDKFKQNPLAADQLLGRGESKPIPLPAQEWAAWTTLFSLLLNLDEAVTRH